MLSDGMLQAEAAMLGSRACIRITITALILMLAPIASIRPAIGESSARCRTPSAAQSRERGCYLLSERSIRGSHKGRAQFAAPNVVAPLPAPDVRPNDDQNDQERNHSNQLTILGWIACVYLFAKGLEFAINPAFYRREGDRAGQIRPAALSAAVAICIAALVLFALLTLQARQVRAP